MPVLGAYCVVIDKERCLSWKMPGKCSTCVEVCPHSVFSIDDMGRVYVLNELACVGCKICIENCPNNVIYIRPVEPERFSRGLWTSQVIEEIHYKAETGKYLLRGFGTMGFMPHFDDLVIVPAQLYPPLPKDKYREECNMEVVIGEGRVKKSLKLKIPIMFAAMSYGAISREAKIALAIATAKMGITTQNPELRKKAAKWISNFINAVTKEVAQITGALGYSSIKDLSREDLRAITLEAAAMAGVKLAGLEDYIPEYWKWF